MQSSLIPNITSTPWDTSLGSNESTSSEEGSCASSSSSHSTPRRSNSEPPLLHTGACISSDAAAAADPPSEHVLIVPPQQRQAPDDGDRSASMAPRRRTTRSIMSAASMKMPPSLLSLNSTSHQTLHRRRGGGFSSTLWARFLTLLFLIATYTTLVLPYPEDLVEDAMSSTPPEGSGAISSPLLQLQDLPRMTVPQNQQQLLRTKATTTLGVGKNNNNNKPLQFARGVAGPAPLKFAAARHEFYQQDAVQQERLWGSWHGAHVSLLALAAAWVLVASLFRTTPSSKSKQPPPAPSTSSAGAESTSIQPRQQTAATSATIAVDVPSA